MIDIAHEVLLDKKDYIKAVKESDAQEKENNSKKDGDSEDYPDYDDEDKDLEEFDKEQQIEHRYFDAD